MANTRVQLEVEAWVREYWMSREYGQQFQKRRVRLTSGGLFEFDAVSMDGSIIASVATSKKKGASGKNAIGSIHKVCCDMFYMLLVDTKRRIQILTEQDMFEHWQKEVDGGRVPSIIEFVHVELPVDLDARLKGARRKASEEVSPK